MYLKEFWLDLSYDNFGIGPRDYVSENDPAHEAIRKFFIETKCITTFFERIFNKRIAADFERIIVECHKEKSERDYVVIDKVCTVNVLFDYKFYQSSCCEKQKHIVLDTLMQGIRKISDVFGWNIQMFESVAKCIVDANYINQWIWKVVPHRKTKSYIELVCSVEREAFHLVANLYDKDNNLTYSKEVIYDSPDELFYRRYFGKTKWKDNSILEIYNKGGGKAVVAARVDFSEYLY